MASGTLNFNDNDPSNQAIAAASGSEVRRLPNSSNPFLQSGRAPQSIAEYILGTTGASATPTTDKAVMSEISREEMEARLKAVSAETDTKIVRMEGKMDLVLSKLDNVLESSQATRANGWVIGLGLAALIVAITVMVPVFYDFGTKTRDLIRDEVKQQTEISKTQAKP